MGAASSKRYNRRSNSSIGTGIEGAFEEAERKLTLKARMNKPPGNQYINLLVAGRLDHTDLLDTIARDFDILRISISLRDPRHVKYQNLHHASDICNIDRKAWFGAGWTRRCYSQEDLQKFEEGFLKFSNSTTKNGKPVLTLEDFQVIS
eukprot:543260-Prorocentrum_minimum.AAC.3